LISRKNKSNRGLALAMFLTLLILVLLLVMALSVLNIGQQNLILAKNGEQTARSFYLAEAGIQDALLQIRNDETLDGAIDTFPDLPLLTRAKTGDSYRLVVTNNFDGDKDIEAPNGVVVPPGFCQILSVGSIDRRTKNSDGEHSQRVAVMIRKAGGGFFSHAVFSGNRTEDPENILTFRGNGKNADKVTGDVHSNSNIDVTEGADIAGNVTATGTVVGVVDATGNDAKLTPPDLRAMNYPTTAHIDVAAEFASSSMDISITPEASYMNSTVQTVDEDNPAHIFAKGVLNNFGTADDAAPITNENYFLADYHTGKMGDKITTSPSAQGKTYFVDGNLWIETGFAGGPMDGQSVIVVKGNIYIADTVVRADEDSALVLVAMADGESYTDTNGNEAYDVGEPILDDDGDGIYNGNKEGSGNIFFGDPNIGPVGQFDGFLYAENNFEDYASMVANWNQSIKIRGSMSAGNRVNLSERVDKTGAHEPVVVEWDKRISDGTLKLPGIPGGASSGGGGSPTIVSWRRG
jgi:hypothetical protein